MRHRRVAVAAWVLWSSFAAIFVAQVVVEAVTGRFGEWLSSAGIALAFVTFATIGASVVARHPRNATGWIYLVGALVAMLGNLSSSWVDLNSAHIASLPGETAARWLNSVLWATAMLVLVPFPLLLFPEGHPPSPRWRPVVWIAAMGVACVSAATALMPGPFEGLAHNPDNPLGITGAKPTLQLLNGIGLFVLGLTMAASIVSLVIRFRGSSGVRRQQFKALGWAGVATLVLLVLAGPGIQVWSRVTGPLTDFFINFFFGAAIAVVPLAVAVSILRYRLWDIDRIISRTVSYAAISGLLAGTFAVVALVPTAVFGSGERPDWVVAAATLVVAALFRPVRRRVQDAVDHRFNRKRYDAEHTLNTFTQRLREHIDIDALGAELVVVVERTMQPSTATIWLRSR